jgi:anti-sigma B factor antagonist
MLAVAMMDVEENTTGIEVTPLDERVTRIVLTGRLDTPGVDLIETRFVAGAVPVARHAVVDISRVEFVASMGIRMFVSAARSMGHRQTRMAIYGARPLVRQVLEHAALGELIPIVADEDEALAAVSS